MSVGEQATVDSIVLSKVEAVEESAQLTWQVTITANFQWCLAFGDKKISPDSHAIRGLPNPISSLSHVTTILECVDTCILCAGNPDEKYSVLVSTRKGIFMDSSGI